MWNSLPAAVRHADSLHSFKRRLKSHFLACVLMIDSVMPFRSSFTQLLANAKVNTWQPWYIGRNSLNRSPLLIAQQYQRNLYIVEKYFQCATIPSLTIWVYLHSFSWCRVPNMRTGAKFRENLNLQQFKVIQGRWFWYLSTCQLSVNSRPSLVSGCSLYFLEHFARWHSVCTISFCLP